jgi:hypothetical protein
VERKANQLEWMWEAGVGQSKFLGCGRLCSMTHKPSSWKRWKTWGVEWLVRPCMWSPSQFFHPEWRRVCKEVDQKALMFKTFSTPTLSIKLAAILSLVSTTCWSGGCWGGGDPYSPGICMVHFLQMVAKLCALGWAGEVGANSRKPESWLKWRSWG